MTNETPRISIGLPVYNGENYLVDAIDSALAQTYSDFELIISDNASTDRTPEICKAYAEKDSRIHYYREEENKGAAWNFNRVFELSKGEYFKWLAHDDKIAPTFLEKCIQVLDSDPSAILAYPEVVIIDENNKQLEQFDFTLRSDSFHPSTRFHDLVLGWCLCMEVFGLIRACELQKTDVMGNYGHGDGVLLSHLGLLGRFIRVPEVLFYSRKHKNQSMSVYGVYSNKRRNNYHTYTLWFDPNKANRLIFPTWKIMAEYSRCIWGSKISFIQKILCYFTVIHWIKRNLSPMAYDLIYAGQFLLHH